jgi:hypothetical protein
VPLHWQYLLAEGTEMPELRMDNPRYRLFIGAWKRLPVPLAARLGPRIVAKLS